MDDVEIVVGHNVLPPAKNKVVKRLVTLIKEGATRNEATEQLGLTKAANREVSLKVAMRKLLEEAYVPADTQRAVLRAGRWKAFMQLLGQGLATNNEGLLKLAAEFSKQIALDPEIGLSQPPQTVLQIDLGDVKELLQNLDPLEGFDKPVIDVEFTEEKSDE